MDREALQIAIAAVLAGAVAMGWLLCLLWQRLSRAPRTQSQRMEVLRRRLLEAETERDMARATQLAAEARLGRAEARLASLDERAPADAEPEAEAGTAQGEAPR